MHVHVYGRRGYMYMGGMATAQTLVHLHLIKCSKHLQYLLYTFS